MFAVKEGATALHQQLTPVPAALLLVLVVL